MFLKGFIVKVWDFCTVACFFEKYSAVFEVCDGAVVARRVFFEDLVGEVGVPVDFSERELGLLPDDLPDGNMQRIAALIDRGFVPLFYDRRVVFRGGEVSLSGPSVFDLQSTRSFQFSLGPCRVEGFDPESGELEVSLSEEQFEELNCAVAKDFSDHGFHSMAFAHLKSGGGFRSMEALSLLKKGLKETGAIVEGELCEGQGSERYAQSAQEKAKVLEGKASAEKRLGRKEREFERLLDEGKKGDLRSLLKAISLCPSSFKPYYSALLAVPVLSRLHPDLAMRFINDAFEISPLLTLNVLLSILFQKEHISVEDYPSTFALLEKRFPSEWVVFAFANAFNKLKGGCLPDRVQEELVALDHFSNCLELGLSSAFYGDFEEAYGCFSRAKCYHISDKRPYMFMALLDLQRGDLVSAIKLTGWMGYLVDWSFKYVKFRNCHWLLRGIDGDIDARPQDEEFIEVSVLKALIALFRVEELASVKKKMEVFHERFLEYLRSPDADLVWADLALSAVEKRLNVFVEDSTVRVQLLFRLYSLFSKRCYQELRDRGADLSAYEDIAEESDGGVVFSISGLITYPEKEKCMFSIHRNSFRLRHDSGVSVLDALLWRRMNDISPLFIRSGAFVSADLLGFLQGLSVDDSPVFPPFMRAFLMRMESEKNIDVVMGFFRWLLTHNVLVPKDARPAITRLFFSNLLESVVPCKGKEELSELGYQWLDQFSLAVSIEGVWDAANVWELFHNEDWNGVGEKLDGFFKDWEEILGCGIDFIALHAICLAKALYDQRGVFSSFPSQFSSPLHEDLCRLAFSIVARDGVRHPLAIPKWDLSREEIEDFCSLFIGPRFGEDDEVYLARLEGLRLMDVSDLRNAGRVNTELDSTALDQGWLIPLSSPHNFKCIQGIVEREVEIVRARLDKSALVRDEAPDYSQDESFIQWVEGRGSLVADYVKNSKAVMRDLPKVSDKVRERFVQELKKKVDHAEHYASLVKKMPKVECDKGKRFWQLVHLTCNVIDAVHAGKRSDGMYDLVLEDEGEARIVALLLWEMGRERYADVLDFAGFFHGPEIHVWGNGPRINHINAGVFRDGKKPESIHLFF
ncbi:MAG: hypothetical protein ChlgKO_11090 [Chlamydiales bacterium]